MFWHEQALLGPSWYPCIFFWLSLRNTQRHSTLAVTKLGHQDSKEKGVINIPYEIIHKDFNYCSNTSWVAFVFHAWNGWNFPKKIRHDRPSWFMRHFRVDSKFRAKANLRLKNSSSFYSHATRTTQIWMTPDEVSNMNLAFCIINHYFSWCPLQLRGWKFRQLWNLSYLQKDSNFRVLKVIGSHTGIFKNPRLFLRADTRLRCDSAPIPSRIYLPFQELWELGWRPISIDFRQSIYMNLKLIGVYVFILLE